MHGVSLIRIGNGISAGIALDSEMNRGTRAF